MGTISYREVEMVPLYFGSIRLQRIECGHQLGAIVLADATVNPYVLSFSLQRYEIMWT